MLGAIAGDIIGSRFENNSIKTKNFELFTNECCFTDDSVMTLAVADAILKCKGDYSKLYENAIKSMQKIGRMYPDCGYGMMFYNWIFTDEPKPYNSFGNGAAMRVSPCGYAAKDMEEAMFLAQEVTRVSHDHPESIKGAQAITACVYFAQKGESKETIKEYINKNFYPMDFALNDIRESYVFDVTCQGSVPQAIMCFLEGENFEDVIRNAVSLGGDSDTIGAMAGGIAQAYFGIPEDIKSYTLEFLYDDLVYILDEFNKKYGI